MLETSTSSGVGLAAMRAPTLIGESCDLAFVELAFAYVDAGSQLEPDLGDTAQDRLGAADRPGRPVERREEAVAGGVALLDRGSGRARGGRQGVVLPSRSRHPRSPSSAARSVEPTMSVKRIVAKTLPGTCTVSSPRTKRSISSTTSGERKTPK